MTDQPAGFRFDIYERVQLPDELPEIGQLQQIELLPRISAQPGQEQVLLRGHLELQADYIPGSEGEVERTFEHRIPVEISLPVRGELSADGIEVEIDRFDVELSTSRSLNVTGLLSITGISAVRESVDQAHVQAAEATPVEALSADAQSADRHPADGQSADEQSGDTQSEVAQSTEGLTDDNRKSKAAAKPKPKSKPKAKEQSETVTVVADDAVFDDEADYLDYSDQAIGGQHQAVSWSQTDELDHEEVTAEEEQQHEPVFAAPEKEETKVAFKAKPMNEAELDGADQSAQSTKSNNALEWRKLFLSGESETRFEKVRLYIAQREDTIESIADRYNLSTRDIAMHNQLNESGVSEGQIVYIPSRS